MKIFSLDSFSEEALKLCNILWSLNAQSLDVFCSVTKLFSDQMCPGQKIYFNQENCVNDFCVNLSRVNSKDFSIVSKALHYLDPGSLPDLSLHISLTSLCNSTTGLFFCFLFSSNMQSKFCLEFSLPGINFFISLRFSVRMSSSHWPSALSNGNRPCLYPLFVMSIKICLLIT